MSRQVLQIARHYVKGEKLKEGTLNRVEAGIRAYDPCLSCSTHAYGEMPLQVELVAKDGTVLDSVARGALPVASRCGVVATSAVNTRTTLVVARFRYHLRPASASSETMTARMQSVIVMSRVPRLPWARMLGSTE